MQFKKGQNTKNGYLDYIRHSRPHSVIRHPTTQALQQFKSIIHNEPHNILITGLNTTPEELSRLCCKRYISGDHMQWVISQLNVLQSSVHCVYLNLVNDIAASVTREKSTMQQYPTALAFIVNCGRDQRSGACFIGDDIKPGHHWALAYYSPENQQLMWGDSIGWDIPTG